MVSQVGTELNLQLKLSREGTWVQILNLVDVICLWSLGLVLPVAAVVDAVAHAVRVDAHGPVAEAVQLRRVAPEGRALCNDK